MQDRGRLPEKLNIGSIAAHERTITNGRILYNTTSVAADII